MMGVEKEYNISEDKAKKFRDVQDQFPAFKPKEDVMRIPFDPNIRMRIPKMPNHLHYRYLYGEVPKPEAQS